MTAGSLPVGEGNGNSLQCSCLENPRDGEPGGLPSMGSCRVGHDGSDLAAAAAAPQFGARLVHGLLVGVNINSSDGTDATLMIYKYMLCDVFNNTEREICGGRTSTFFTFVRALSISSGNMHAFNTEKKGVPLMNTHLLTLAGIKKLAETRTSA